MNECGVSTITDNVSISFFFLLLSFLYSCRIDVWRECENYIAPLKCVPAQRRSILENETRSLRFPRVIQSKAHKKKIESISYHRHAHMTSTLTLVTTLNSFQCLCLNRSIVVLPFLTPHSEQH